MTAAVIILALACALLAAALVAHVAVSSTERTRLLRQIAAERETLLRAAMAKDGLEFEQMERTAKYGEVLVERERQRLVPPAREHSPAPEGLG